MPGGPDLVVMALSQHNHSMMPVYVIAAVIGSTLGCLVPYWVGRKAGDAALRAFSAEKKARVTGLVNRYGLWSMLAGALLPPPFPFKVLLITAGAFRVKIWQFLGALAIGRAIRFILEGLIAVRYGDQAAGIFKDYYPAIGLGCAAVVLAILIFNMLRNRRQRDSLTDSDLSAAK
ncbi:MAG: DedA family protein [Blastocatellia bacterium]|nr:DedA family protein [Blastocatellia bacterium]